MAELSKQAQALIDAAQSADDPMPEARARGDAAVRVALAMHGLTDLPPLAPPPPSSGVDGASPAPITHAGIGLKIGVGVALLSATLLAVFGAQRIAAPQRAPGAQAAGAAERAPAEPVARLPAAAPPERRAVTAVERRAPPERARHRPRGKSTPSSAALEAEVRMIAEANGLIRAHRFAEALRVLEQHYRRFPRGTLREERNALRVLSQCGAGALDAPAQRERFLGRSPSSVLAERVRAACGVERVP